MTERWRDAAAAASRILDEAFNELQLVAPDWVVTPSQVLLVRAQLWLASTDGVQRWKAFEEFQFSRIDLARALRADMDNKSGEEFIEMEKNHRAMARDLEALDSGEAADKPEPAA